MRGDMNRFFSFFFILMFLLTGCSSERTIANNLEERDANEIMVFLANKGIPSAKVAVATSGGGGGAKIAMYDIQVPDSRATEAMAMLNMAGLPRRHGESLLGIFTGGGLVPSQMEEKIRYQQGLAQNIANTIRKIDGVLDADVQLSFPEEDPLNPEKNIGQVTASVYVKHNGVLDDPNAHLVTKIRRLVASSIPGLKFDNVTVIGDRARFTNSPVETTATSADRGLVSVWSVLVAKESTSRFQLVFFTFLILISLLLIALVWLIWKFHLLLQQAGGISSLFSLHPIDPSHLEESPSGEIEGEEKGTEPTEPPAPAATPEAAKKEGAPPVKEEPPKGAK